MMVGMLAMMAGCWLLVGANNVCYVEESGCKFRVTVLPVSSCPASRLNDQPDDVAKVSTVHRYDIDSICNNFCYVRD